MPCPFQKLSKRFFGPFRISQRVASVAYQLDLLSSARIHNVFHVSLLKPYLGPLLPQIVRLLKTLTESLSLLEPSSILDRRVLVRDGVPVSQVLPEWKHFGIDDATWEDADTFAASYFHSDLEDMVLIELGGTVTTRNMIPITDPSPTTNSKAVVHNEIMPRRSRRTHKAPLRYQV